jgi:cytochrome P450
VALRELSQSRLLITKPNVLADLLVHRVYDFEKPKNMRKFLRNLVGDGLLMIEGDAHKFMRKNTNPAFSLRPVKNLYPMMWRSSLSSAEKLERDIRGQAKGGGGLEGDGSLAGNTEITLWANKTTLNIIGNAVLGRDFDVAENSEDPLVKSYETIFNPTNEMLLYFVVSAWVSHGLAQALPWKMNAVFKETTGTLNRICMETTQERRRTIKEGGDDHVDILSQLIQSGLFSDKELVDQLLTFLAAG